VEPLPAGRRGRRIGVPGHRTARSNALDHRGAALRFIGELRALGDFSCALPEARFVRERVRSLTVAPERPRPVHLYAAV
jgi:hypothetical protein